MRNPQLAVDRWERGAWVGVLHSFHEPTGAVRLRRERTERRKEGVHGDHGKHREARQYSEPRLAVADLYLAATVPNLAGEAAAACVPNLAGEAAAASMPNLAGEAARGGGVVLDVLVQDQRHGFWRLHGVYDRDAGECGNCS